MTAVDNKVSPGVSKWDLDTPALCVDLDKMERNVAKMQATVKRERHRQPAALENAQVRGDRAVPDRDRVGRDLLRQGERGRGDVRSTASRRSS